jgi:hypothetical protein
MAHLLGMTIGVYLVLLDSFFQRKLLSLTNVLNAYLVLINLRSEQLPASIVHLANSNPTLNKNPATLALKEVIAML